MNITQETATYIINRMKPHLNDNQMMILEYASKEITNMDFSLPIEDKKKDMISSIPLCFHR